MADQTDIVGECVKHFSVEERLGEGGMGAVYRARDTILERDVALKVIHPELAADEHHRRRLLREARAIAAVSHPHIATVYESGEDDGLLYIAMELVPGRSLRDHLSEGPLSPLRAVEIARQIASALERAHQAGVVHRDLKPDNVILGPDGAKVLDFGIARRGEASPSSRAEQAEADTALTAEGSVVGTPGYMSPEQALGLPIDPRTDLFSLGVLLFEMVTGALPFAGGTPVAAAAAVSRDQPTPLREHVIDEDASVECLQEVIDRCLEKAPGDRYADAATLLAGLQEADERLRALPSSGQTPLRASPEAADAKRAAVQPRSATVEPTLVARTRLGRVGASGSGRWR